MPFVAPLSWDFDPENKSHTFGFDLADEISGAGFRPKSIKASDFQREQKVGKFSEITVIIPFEPPDEIVTSLEVIVLLYQACRGKV